MIGKVSLPDWRGISTRLRPDHEMVRCFRHKGEDCPRCDGSGYRPRRHCAGCGEPAGQPSQGGKALVGLRNGRGWKQPFYCLGCHPRLCRGPEMLKRMGG